MPLTLQQILGDLSTQPQVSVPLNELINKHDLAELPAEKSNGFEQDETLIPNVMHYIYVVNPINDPKQLELIKKFKLKNPDYQAVLWIDTKVYSEKERADLIQWAKTNQIHLMDIDKCLNQQMGNLQRYYQLEISRRKPGPASDILRTILLKNFGGLYSDIDVLCNDALGEIHDVNGIQLNFGKRKMTRAGTHPLDFNVTATLEKAPNNDLLIARPNHPFINEFMQLIRENYNRTATTLFPTTGTRDFIYEKAYKSLGSTPFRKQWTIYATGPGALLECANSTNLPITKEISVADKFIFGCSLSWNKNYKINALPHNEEVNRLVTCMLLDLYHEPRVLRLGNYFGLCSSDAVMDEAVAYIANYHPESFQEIESVHNLIEHNNLGYFPKLEVLFNEELFPKLKNQSEVFTHYLLSVFNNADSLSFDNRINELVTFITEPPFEIKSLMEDLFYNQLPYLKVNNMEKQANGMSKLLDVVNKLNQQPLISTDKLFNKFVKQSFNVAFIAQLMDKNIETTMDIKRKVIKQVGTNVKKLSYAEYETNTFPMNDDNNKTLHFLAKAAPLLKKLDEKTHTLSLSDYSKEKASFQSVRCENLSFRNSKLNKSNFNCSDIKQCDFSKADLTEVSFENCKLSEVNFNQANISGAKFSNAILDRIQWGDVEFSFENPPLLDWNTHGINLLLDKLSAMGGNEVSLLHKQQQAKNLVQWMLPRITDLDKLVNLVALIENKHSDFEYLRQEHGFYSLFNSHGNTSGWKFIMSQIKNHIDQQIISASSSAKLEDPQVFGKFKKIMNEHTGRGFGAVTHEVKAENFNEYRSTK